MNELKTNGANESRMAESLKDMLMKTCRIR